MAGDSDARQTDRPGEARPGRRPSRGLRVLSGALYLALNLLFGGTMLAVLLAGLIWLRLAEGPIHLPFAAEAAAKAFNSGSDRLRAEASDVVLTLGEQGGPAGVHFIDVRLSYASGELLFVVPRLAARFHASDLVQGRLRPIRIAVIRPEARLERTSEGRFRFGLGPSGEAADSPHDASAPAEPVQFQAVGRILDGLAGDAEPVPALARLEAVEIRDAQLTFENPAAGRRWETEQADLRVWRSPAGLRARMEVGLADDTGTGAGAVVTAERRRGREGATQIEARFSDLRPEHLAEQLPRMEWLRLFDARLDGRLEATLHPDGRVEGLAGRISAGTGRILALGDRGQPFDKATLEFAYEAGRERMRVREFVLDAPAAEARLAGFAELRRDADGALAGLAGQFQVARLRADLPEVFAEPLAFEAGQIVARLDLEPLSIEVARSHLRAGDLVVEVEGRASPTGDGSGDGWGSQMRAAARNMSVAGLVRLWPHVAAGKARKWVEENIHAASVDEFVAHLRFGGARPEVSLDFRYSGLEASYLDDMSPIVAASGRGSLTLDTFHLAMDSGEVRPADGAPVRLDGSVLRIPDLEGDPAEAEITLRGRGPTAHVLALINEEPLRLTRKLGLAPASVGGEAELVAKLGFPLIDELDLDDVEVSTEAALSDLAMPFQLPGGPEVEVRADEVALRADPQEMRVAGPVRVDGRPLDLEWNEFYGRGDNHRSIVLDGPVTPAFLDRLELGTEYFAGGEAPVRLSLEQSGNPEFGFELEADLGPARLAVSEFDWQKPPGPGGRLVAEGTFDDGIRVPAFELETEELKARGAITFADGGGMRTAEVARLRFRGLADVSLTAESLEDGKETLRLDVGGRRLELALFEGDSEDGDNGDAAGDAPGRPLDVDFDLGELVITPKIVARPGKGSYRREASGRATAALEGVLAGQVPFTADYEKAPGEAATVKVRADDAGALLAAAGLFGGAEGGRLELQARLTPEPGTDLEGVARMEDVRIHSGGTFRSMLAEGGVEEAAKAAETGGLSFDRVRVPFAYRDGVMELGESLARGNMLAVKLEGSVNENTEAVALSGVISPAYGLTGALDSIPVLGRILSGGEGEGILAMTFRVRGTLDDPEFSVNPLSLLTPGILRNIFPGGSREPDERFLDQLGRD